MGMKDQASNMMHKAKEKMASNPDKSEQAVKRAADKADRATGGKYGDQIDKGEDRAQDEINKMNER